MTPDQYTKSHIVDYPTLFAKSTFEESKRTVMGGVFNSLCSEVNETLELFKWEPNQELLNQYSDKYHTNKIFWGYEKILTYSNDDGTPILDGNGEEMTYPDPSCESITVLECDKDKHPEIKMWMEATKHTHNPYPNFQKKYSVLWNGLDNIPDDWRKEAITYYQWCLDYFNDPKQYSHFHHAFPKADENDTQRTIDEYKRFIENNPKYPTHQDVTDAYGGVEYNGDMPDFIHRLWEKTRQEYITFIKETLTLLNDEQNS